MAKQVKVTLLVIFGMMILVGCGGSESEPSATDPSESEPSATDPSESAATESEADAPAPTVASDDEQASDEAVPATTTPATAPEPLLSADDAIDMYDDYVDELVNYTRANLVDGDGTFEEAQKVLARIDPALLDGALDNVALAFHNCSAESAIEARAFFEITDVDLEIEHIEQHEINPETWALDIRQFVRLEGFPETVNDATVLVTIDGAGPTVVTTADEPSCSPPKSAEAESLISEAKQVLAIAEPATTTGELRSADEVVAEQASSESLQGALGEPLRLREGLTVIINSIEPGGDDGGPWLAASIRVENTGSEASNPEVGIVCAGSTDAGFTQADSSFEQYAPLPASTFSEGVIHLLLPGDGRYGEAIPECATPAVIRVTDWGGTATADFPIPDNAVAELLR